MKLEIEMGTTESHAMACNDEGSRSVSGLVFLLPATKQAIIMLLIRNIPWTKTYYLYVVRSAEISAAAAAVATLLRSHSHAIYL